MTIIEGGAPLSIANGVREFARATPGQVAVVEGDRRLTYAAVHERACRLGSTLSNLGLRPGERVAVLLGNRAEYPEIAAGISMAGLVMVPLNPRLTASELRFILDHSSSRFVITDARHSDLVTGWLTSTGTSALSIGPTADPDHEGTASAVPPSSVTLDGGSLYDYEWALAQSPPVDPAVPHTEQDPFCIAYTSGTTGRPKGVVISHRSRCLTFYMAALEWGLGAGRTSVAVAPMYHGAGFAFGYAPVHTGGTVVMLPKWDPLELLRLIEREKAQSVFLVPTHAQMLRALGAEVLSGFDLSSLDTLYFNAAALPWSLKQWVMDTFPEVGVHELYGSTEAGIIANLRPGDMRRKPGSVGPPWFMTEVRVLDGEGQPVAPGGHGQLWSRSPYLMNGYLDDDEATAGCTTDDGFLTCGDIVTVDEEGFITIVDRVTDMIISGGVNVYPREVEEVILGHPDVAEVAVVGTPHQTWGQQVSAFVVLTEGASASRDTLEAFCRDNLAGFKVPRSWEFLPALPRNAGGKVLKRELREAAGN